METDFSVQRLLGEIGSGRMMNTAYDTAWVARLHSLGESMGDESLEWLRANQLPDGSWGAGELRYHHDRLVCTLAAMTALARESHQRNRRRLQRAQLALESVTEGLRADPAGETIGFEMIVPTLMAEAEDLGIVKGQHDGVLGRLQRYRAAKLAALPEGMINRHVTVAFSAEMAGPDGLQLLDVEHLQESNGSVGHSPSATAYFALYVQPQEQAAMTYLQRLAANGGIPNVSPFDVFEQAWALWNLAQAGPLDDSLLARCQPHLDFLESTWRAKLGIGFAAGYTPTDSDVTSVVYEVLTRYGRPADLEAILSFEEDACFRCYNLEANPSISANIHVLGALRQGGLAADHPTVAKVRRFLRRTQSLQLFWFDKWHASPYYPTSHAIIASAGYDDELIEDAVYWIQETQNLNGSWGFYVATAEETACCLQALIAWQRNGGGVKKDVVRRGAAWLGQHGEPPYPPLWIGKCLYCPELVVRSTILGALRLVEQEYQTI